MLGIAFPHSFRCAVALLAALAAAGCVQRRMTIRSNPPGALVYVDDYQIGTTPVSTDFVYYGTRKIRLVKDGYETLTVRQPFPLPWYQVFPLDFVTENIWPGEIRDERVVDLAMSPLTATPAEEVVARAEQARASAGSLPAPPPVAPQVVVPQPIPAPPPAQMPLPQPLPAPQMLPPQPQSQFQPLPGTGPVFPPQVPAPVFQAPLQNAPSQGIPSLGVP
ncbi:MAG: PEGA domain-containing protein [Planctomycetia bacterium]